MKKISRSTALIPVTVLALLCCLQLKGSETGSKYVASIKWTTKRIFKTFESVLHDKARDVIQENFISFHKIDAAWKISRGVGVKVAVLDWLFDMSPEAAKKYVDQVSLVPGQKIGFADPWHGEWMANIVHRIAPEAKIIPIRARPQKEEKSGKAVEEQPYERFLIEGIRYAADHGAAAVTNSMGPVRQSEKLLDAVAYAAARGTVFINVHPEYMEKKNGAYIFCDSSHCSPLIIHAGIISVPDYPLEPDPARDIATWPYDMDPAFRDGWGFSNGPPVIAGVVALMKSVNPALTVKERKELLMRTGDMKDGFRVLNAEKAVTEAGHRARTQEKETMNSIGMRLRLVEDGTFIMGADDGGPIGQSKPAHRVTLTRDFYMGVFEVTQAQYQAIMGENPSEFKAPGLPVAGVTFKKATAFCRRLSQKEGLHYRLPYEAEWEYVCRAGTDTKYPWGNDPDAAGEYGWHEGNSGNRPHKAGMKKANRWGFHDMCGNVQEFTADIYGLYQPGPVTDPKGPSEPWGTLDCTLRSGSYELSRALFDASFRHGIEKDSENPMNTVGFRVVREIE